MVLGKLFAIQIDIEISNFQKFAYIGPSLVCLVFGVPKQIFCPVCWLSNILKTLPTFFFYVCPRPVIAPKLAL